MGRCGARHCRGCDSRGATCTSGASMWYTNLKGLSTWLISCWSRSGLTMTIAWGSRGRGLVQGRVRSRGTGRYRGRARVRNLSRAGLAFGFRTVSDAIWCYRMLSDAISCCPLPTLLAFSAAISSDLDCFSLNAVISRVVGKCSRVKLKVQP